MSKIVFVCYYEVEDQHVESLKNCSNSEKIVFIDISSNENYRDWLQNNDDDLIIDEFPTMMIVIRDRKTLKLKHRYITSDSKKFIEKIEKLINKK